MIEYVTLDYGGKPVTIEDGEMYDEVRYDVIWNSDTCEWEDDEDYYEECWDDDYYEDMNGNFHYRYREGRNAEEARYFYADLI